MPPQSDKLILYLDAADSLSLDPSTSNTTWNDLSPQGNHVTLHDVNFVVDANDSVTAVGFKGASTSYADAANLTGLLSTSLTVVMYFKPGLAAAPGIGQTLFSVGRSPTNFTNQFVMSTTRVLEMGAALDPWPYMPDQAWSQLAYRLEGPYRAYHLNVTGQRVPLSTTNHSVSFGNDTFTIGHDPYQPTNSSGLVTGEIAAMLVYNATLTTNELAVIHDQIGTRLQMASAVVPAGARWAAPQPATVHVLTVMAREALSRSIAPAFCFTYRGCSRRHCGALAWSCRPLNVCA